MLLSENSGTGTGADRPISDCRGLFLNGRFMLEIARLTLELTATTSVERLVRFVPLASLYKAVRRFRAANRHIRTT